MIEEHDSASTRCPQLGGDVPFQYCRTLNQGLPCRSIMVCWEYRIPVSKFLEAHYPAEEIRRAFTPSSKTRLDTILEIAENAKRRKTEEK
ncbi:MAG: hypothetical protein A2162_03270 [Deltaproteobacteria bacterium RBG_13_52_11b]|nr:MAG: hypothetical protein A2162_03270 [Deltaproteobacteria bacterium RBG_13_52_11b]